MMKNGLLVRWDITKKCNLKCKHCINGNKYLNTQEASFEEKKQIIDNLATGGVSRIHLLGGEATTVDKIEELVEYACSKGIRVSLNTNSIVMAENESLCNTFAKCDVDVSFSIDGTTAELHEQIRGRGTYDAIIKASQKYYELTKNKRVVRAFYYTLTPDNKHDDFNRLFSLAANLGINNIVVGVMIPLGHGKENYHGKTLDGDELLDIAEKVLQIAKSYPEIIVSFPFQTPLFLKYMGRKTERDYGICYSKCKSGVCEFSLEPNGILYPCIYISESYAKSINCEISANSIIDYSFGDITENNFFCNVHDKLNDSSIMDKVEPCTKCPYYRELGLCKPCAFQHTFATDDYHKNQLCADILRKTGGDFLLNSDS